MPLVSPPLPGGHRPPPIPLIPPFRPAVAPSVVPPDATPCLSPPLDICKATATVFLTRPTAPIPGPLSQVGFSMLWHVALLPPSRRPPSTKQCQQDGAPHRTSLHFQHNTQVADVPPPPGPQPQLCLRLPPPSARPHSIKIPTCHPAAQHRPGWAHPPLHHTAPHSAPPTRGSLTQAPLPGATPADVVFSSTSAVTSTSFHSPSPVVS